MSRIDNWWSHWSVLGDTTLGKVGLEAALAVVEFGVSECDNIPDDKAESSASGCKSNNG
jgi:hypothetical protein